MIPAGHPDRSVRALKAAYLKAGLLRGDEQDTSDDEQETVDQCIYGLRFEQVDHVDDAADLTEEAVYLAPWYDGVRIECPPYSCRIDLATLVAKLAAGM